MATLDLQSEVDKLNKNKVLPYSITNPNKPEIVLHEICGYQTLAMRYRKTTTLTAQKKNGIIKYVVRTTMALLETAD